MKLLKNLSLTFTIHTILFAFLLTSKSISPAIDQSHFDSLFHIKLNTRAIELVKKIETLYGKKIKQEWMSEDSKMAGKSKVDSDGTPIIYIHPTKGKYIDVIIHELYHFIQRDEGYPVINWLFPEAMNSESNINAFNQLTIQMSDPILHYIFFPVIRSWGINPNGAVERETLQALNNGSFEKMASTMNAEAVALWYYMARLTFGNKKLFNSAVKTFETKPNKDGLILGKKITQIVIDENPKSPAEEINCLVLCLNIFYKGQFHFTVVSWTSRQLGKHIQKIAQIELQPL